MSRYSPAHIDALKALFDAGADDQRTAAAPAGVGANLWNRLRSAGHVERFDRDDHHVYALTPAGRAALNRAQRRACETASEDEAVHV